MAALKEKVLLIKKNLLKIGHLNFMLKVSIDKELAQKTAFYI
jgi:hypothetical protein